MNQGTFLNRFSLMARAAFKRTDKKVLQGKLDLSLPAKVVRFSQIAADPNELNNYYELIGWPEAKCKYLHPCYLHILAFPLHIRLMLQDDFPFSLLGLVHLHNRLEQFRNIGISEILDVSCYLSDLQEHPKGWIFSIVTEVKADNELVWKSVSSNLYRIKSSATSIASNQAIQHPVISGFNKDTTWNLASNIGRRYAKVSGDYNLIHLYPLLARLFGFKRHIAHGMWSKARCISALAGYLDESFVVNVDFKKAIFLPTEVLFSSSQLEPANTAGTGHQYNFTLSSLGNQQNHLSGELYT